MSEAGDHHSSDLVLHVGHAFVLIGEPRLRQRIVGRHMHERERAQLVVALRREDVHRAMVVELGASLKSATQANIEPSFR